MNLQINLQDGFNGDEVKISINGKQAYHQMHVKTRTQIGVADRLETQVDNGPVSIEIQLINKQIKQVIETQVTATTHIGISVSQQNKIEFQVQDIPFYYM